MSENKKRSFRKPTFKKPNFKKPKRKLTPGFFVTILSILVSSIIVIGLAGSAVATLIITDILEGTPTLNVDDFVNPDSTKIYDSEGEIIADIGMHMRENITYEQMPQALVDAFVAVEDSRFFIHNGFDLPRFAKALLTNLQQGSFAEGGSTFTMQLVKDTYFVSEEALAPRTLDRKFQEISLALELENELSKKRILELYVNNVNYGAPNSLGIQTAAQYYFGKDIEALNLSESAFLAGVINAPNLNNPYRYLENGTKRRNVVLDLMLRHGYIDELEQQQAKDIKLEDLLVGNLEDVGEAIPYQSYIDAVIQETIELTGKDPYIQSMNIYTHMNRELQETMEAIANGETSVDFGHDLLQMAAVSMDHTTGEIVAISGGRDYTGQRMFNRAIHPDAKNQLGSAVKPLLSYALAFEYLGLSTSHVIRDQPIVYRNSDIIIQNADRRYIGDMPLEVALTISKNTPAVQLLEGIVDTIGIARVVEYLNSIGFSRVSTNSFNLGHAIGSFEASVAELTGAYGMLLNQGVFIQPHTIARIEFKDGTEPLMPTYASTRSLSTEAAYLSSHFMERAVSGGYANWMGMLNRSYPVYAKTGTSDWGREGLQYGIPEGVAKEIWMVAGTNKYINTLWLGFDRAVEGEGTWITSDISNRNLRGNILKILLDKQGEIENDQFRAIPRPSGVVDITHILGTFPYANVISGMDPDLITTGMIKREFANLVDLQVEIPEIISNVDATLNINGSQNIVQVTLDQYPNPEQLVIAPSTVEMELTAGNKTVRTTGTRLFDPSWIFGPVRYVAQVNANNNTYTEISDTRIIDIMFDGKLETNVEVCGFYAYEGNIESRSNELCETLDLTNASIAIPNFTTLLQFEEWAATFNITNIEKTTVTPRIVADIGKIDSIRFNDALNMLATRTLSELRAGTFKVSYFEAETIDLTTLIGQKYNDINSWPHRDKFTFLTTPSGALSSWEITDILYNGISVDSIRVIGKPQLVLVLENTNSGSN